MLPFINFRQYSIEDFVSGGELNYNKKLEWKSRNFAVINVDLFTAYPFYTK
jgi:hypothetical protein